jgi:hypothetical protein
MVRERQLLEQEVHMKLLALLLGLMISSPMLASTITETLSFEDDLRVEKVVMMDQILINDLINLYNELDTEGDRMIAGKFESKKKIEKKSYLDDLRTKLDGSKNLERF